MDRDHRAILRIFLALPRLDWILVIPPSLRCSLFSCWAGASLAFPFDYFVACYCPQPRRRLAAVTSIRLPYPSLVSVDHFALVRIRKAHVMPLVQRFRRLC